MFDPLRDQLPHHKAAALIRNTTAVQWETSRPVLAELGIVRAFDDLGMLTWALYRGKVGILSKHDRADVRDAVDLRDGRLVATLYIRDGFKLP